MLGSFARGALLSGWVIMGVFNAEALNRAETRIEGRGSARWLTDGSVRVEDCCLVLTDEKPRDSVFRFKGRAPVDAGSEEVGIWAGFRRFDRNHRYVLGVRGAPHSDLYLARYAPDGNDRMLALSPIPTVKPGEWVDVRVETRQDQLRVYINGEERASVEDPKAPFKAGGFSLGGGYHGAEFKEVSWSVGAPVGAANVETPTFVDGAVKINFQPDSEPALEGWKSDAGKAYTASRGHGWSRDLGTRKRGKNSDVLRDTLVTIAHDVTTAEFRVDVPPGEYALSLQHGDQFPSALRVATVMGASLADKRGAGEFERIERKIMVSDDGLKLRFDRNANGPGTSINWLALEPRGSFSAEDWSQVGATAGMTKEKAAKRTAMRAAYEPVRIERIGEGRQVVSLDGDWLFLPDYEFESTPNPADPGADDEGWHVMSVPDLWSPYAAWLFGETFPDMPYDKGASDSYYEYRHARVEAFTFDWEKTRSAWYRKHLVLPELPAEKRVELCFDAIAKVAEIYVNGRHIAKNYGMFGEIKHDVTPYLAPGVNVVAVKVDEERMDIEGGDEIIDVAISVEVTKKMLSALPYGMTRQDARGIWQSTRLVMTDDARVTDIFVKPRLDGAEVEVTLENLGSETAAMTPELLVAREKDGASLVEMTGETVSVPAGESVVTTLRFGGVKPLLWAPDHPELYTFEARVGTDRGARDAMRVVSGFKTFETRGNRFYLNGKPYALRGANHCPNMLAPNDGDLANRFMEIMRENNLNATRFHALPGTKAWMDAADRNGVLISYEGTWPWLMLRGPIPPRESLDIWMDEFQRVVKRYRNHPSLALWTVNNEMKFHVWHAHDQDRTAEDDAAVLERWKVVSEAVKMIRETDPTHPIVADSCYMRNDHWRLSRTPEELGIDDGDVDDRHGYYNWYNESVFNLFEKKDHAGAPERPYIGQELSTGYYNGDSGHPVRAYLFAHQTPQSWVGQWAYEHHDPSIFMNRHAMLTKELAEYYRRERRDDWAGSLIFGLATWFREQWCAENIEPYPVVTEGLRKAMAPVLVSARLTSRNAYAGEAFAVPVSIVNDSEDGAALPAGKLEWSFTRGERVLARGVEAMPPVPYYANRGKTVSIVAPREVDGGREDLVLRFRYVANGKIVAENGYEMTIGQMEWAREKEAGSGGARYVFGDVERLRPMFERLKTRPRELTTLKNARLKEQDVLVVCGEISREDENFLNDLIGEGVGRVVWAHPRQQAERLFPDRILDYRKQDGEVVTMLVPESPVFDELRIGDLAWMGGVSVTDVPRSSTGGYHVAWKEPGLTVLAEEMRAHGYLKTPKDKLKYWVAPLVEIQREGETPVVLSEMSIDAARTDPLALRLWANLLL